MMESGQRPPNVLAGFSPRTRGETPRRLGAAGGLSEQTQTIDLNSLFATNLTESGSFHVGTVRKTTFAKLLDALPMPAALLHADNTILFGNQSFAPIQPNREQWTDTGSLMRKRAAESDSDFRMAPGTLLSRCPLVSRHSGGSPHALS